MDTANVQSTSVARAHVQAALIQHVFTRVLPIPLAHDHPNKAQCMWTQPLL
jgi:hypothetical protein